jgi:hypothetical protein
MPSKIVVSKNATKAEKATKVEKTSKVAKKSGKKSSGQKETTVAEKAQYNLLAFDKGKTRVQGSYVGRSPPQVAKKVLKQLKRKGGDQKGSFMFLRKVGHQKVSVYVGYNKPLAQPIFAYEKLIDDEANPGQKIATIVKTREVLKDATGVPLVPKFTHTHSAQVVRVGIYPGGL